MKICKVIKNHQLPQLVKAYSRDKYGLIQSKKVNVYEINP